jgi:tetratricopeptide (TPR) repeat protein
LEQLKTEGNTAFVNKDYTRAVHFYNEALVVAQQSPDLYKEAAILYSNKSNVRYQTGDTENALINAIAAINSDPEYSKVSR